jgi:multiple sugar transport system permease protein
MHTTAPLRRAPRITLGQGVLFATLLLVALIWVFPLVWMLATSLKPEAEVTSYPPRVLPQVWTLAAYADVWSRIPFGRFALNSLIVATGVTVISLFFDSLAAYALARLTFPGRDAILLLVLVALMLPFQVTFIPTYVTVQQLGLLDSYGGLIIPRATSAFGIFMLRQFFSTLPRELDDAARVDGASDWFIYARIIMPLAGPALATLAVFHFMYNWNDFLWPLLITNTTAMRTLPAGLALFMGQHVVEYAVVMAGATLALTPLFIAFICAQQYFVQGIAMSGLKE